VDGGGLGVLWVEGFFSRSYILLYAETEAPEHQQNKKTRREARSERRKRILFVGECYYSHYSISLLLFMSKALC
jgi:hypothetical protein